MVIGKNFILSHSSINIDFDVHERTARDLLKAPANELIDERWTKLAIGLVFGTDQGSLEAHLRATKILAKIMEHFRDNPLRI